MDGKQPIGLKKKESPQTSKLSDSTVNIGMDTFGRLVSISMLI